MKVKNIIALLVALIFLAIIVTMTSCCASAKEETKTVETTKPVDTVNYSHYEVIGHPVIVQHIKRKGMEYLIISGKYSEAGVAITNLTLDSLQAEYYKSKLKK